jgi:hypothetical protein
MRLMDGHQISTQIPRLRLHRARIHGHPRHRIHPHRIERVYLAAFSNPTRHNQLASVLFIVISNM